jgi:hypothetical protein
MTQGRLAHAKPEPAPYHSPGTSTSAGRACRYGSCGARFSESD